VDLRPWAGATVNLSLITECGPAGDCNFDWAGWADVRVVSVQQGFFEESMAPENPAIRHILSIFDWAEDETNRDRLAAWRTGLSAWQSNPNLGEWFRHNWSGCIKYPARPGICEPRANS
jgi:hypothetical protein